MGWADVATLKNGDRVTGALVNIKGGNLQLKTDTLGTLSIPVANLTAYSSAQPVAVITTGQEPVQGNLELTSSGAWQVTVNGQVQPVDMAKVNVIMPWAEYQKAVEANPKLWQAWKGGASLGYSLQNGNQRTNTIAGTLNAVRERPATPIFQDHWRTNFDFTTLLSHAQQDGNTVTSHTITANLREDYLVSSDNFLFIMGQANHVSTQGLYLQQTYGGGYGRDIIHSARTVFSVSTGPAYLQEKFFTGLLTRTVDLLIAEKLGEQFNKRLRLDHYLEFYPDLKYRGEYRFDTSTVLSYKLSSKFSVNASAIDLYLSNPPAGNEKNDISVSLGVGYSF
jgi:putative salt-induced outer membrane protein YdiY